MTHEKLFDKELMMLDANFENQRILFKEVSKDLLKKGFVTETYADALNLREKEFPTGLETAHCKIAIPHTDVKHVKKPFIYLVKLDEEIVFNNMGDMSQSFGVKAVLFLGIKEPAEQIKLLSKLMENFIEKSFSDLIFEEKNKNELEIKLNNFI
ncbi:PTS sugar transporter subunit IIA [Corticicoccus populi]|uniref:PTS sugar transporter subunit IIA n=1 Tax=Corticicoccus populi TaxID=1812821 RepID=A0ABW5WZV5_9STAP